MLNPPAAGCGESDCPYSTSDALEDSAEPELARANLLRMRGQFDDARAVCMGILKRLPGDVTAHVLLGDIFAEQGQLDEARQWYELGLDLRPESLALAAKRDEIKKRLEDRQAAKTIQQLGLSPTKSRATSVLVGTSLFVAVVGIAGFFAGRSLKSQPAPAPQPAIEVGAAPIAKPASTPEPKAEPSTDPAPGPWRAAEDDALLARIQKECEDGNLVRQAIALTSSRSAILSVSTNDEAALKRLTSQIFAKLTDVDSVTVRVFNAGVLTKSIPFSRTPVADPTPAAPTSTDPEPEPAPSEPTGPAENPTN
jgi:tetratricopeptide (TPR) repeat protein